jgi:hypothetical protein
MERVLGSPLVFPHLPMYYFHLVEANLNAQLLQNLLQELSQVKGAHLSEMLAYKSALLNVVVGGGGLGVGRPRSTHIFYRKIPTTSERRLSGDNLYKVVVHRCGGCELEGHGLTSYRKSQWTS